LDYRSLAAALQSDEHAPTRKFGVAGHIAARVSALAGPSEELVSRTVKDLVAGSGIEFSDRGTHALKGVPDTWQPYAVAA
jgi:class 3 adenylate cyclase